jgi:predicted metal-dependent phosphoesterase TrpH
MAFRVDFHTHTGHSKDSLLPAERLLAAAARRGLAAVAVTDHNTLGGARQALALAERKASRFGGLRVLPGTEVKTTEGEIIGLLVRDDVPRGLTPEETIRRIHDQGGLALLPHPFDRVRGSRLNAVAAERVAHLIDAVEARNARTTLLRDNQAAEDFARRHGLPLVAGSDAHTAGEVGAAYLDLDEPPSDDSARLLEQIKRGRVGGRPSPPLVHAWSKLAAWRKRLGLAPAVQL